ncbi:fimbrial assembly protein [Bacillus sp. V3-13]|uniref:fimbrial assembly protein n=1 Tax=Bacillus sp. V3-13 TaxID=2053728 RepID=UPI000C764780|nr:fimbrial assembly protein [Bacillus sp. V3-13]PLR75504.1 fimbrial assembly protein [Bacillus sp. V3-13]
MLADINLLPKKEPRNKTAAILLAVAAAVLITGIAVFYWQLEVRKQNLESIENQLRLTNDIIEVEGKKLADHQSVHSVEKLETAITRAGDQRVNTVYLLQELTRLLPERGFITEFAIDQEYLIKQVVQFDTKSEAAYYLNALVNIDWVKEAIVKETKAGDWEVLNNNTGVSDEELVEIGKKEYLPRYYAEYEVKLDIPALKKAYSEAAGPRSADTEEGGETP